MNSESKLEQVNALMRASKAVLEYESFEKSARKIFDEACNLIGATSGYIALLSSDGLNNEVLFLESGGENCTVDPSLPMPIRGLREEAYRKQVAVFNNDFMNSEFVNLMPQGHMILNNILFAPLIVEKQSVGVMGLANKPTPFTNEDTTLAMGFSEFASIALVNSQNLDKLRKTIQHLEDALHEVKTLKGLLPICSKCKNIRDDQGYWHQVEAYMTERADMVFTHSLCPKCAKELYPDL